MAMLLTWAGLQCRKQNDPSEQLKLRGYHMVAGAVDIAMFRKATLDDVRLFREAVMEIDEEDDEDEKCEKENDGYWSDRVSEQCRTELS